MQREVSLPRELVANHLHVNLVTHAKPHTPNEVLIDPRFEFTHPMCGQYSPALHALFTCAYQSVVF